MTSTCFVKVCYALLLLSLHAAGCIHGYNLETTSEDVKCIENERQSLLSFKQSLLDRYGMLSTWSDKHSNRDCCKWKGVQCSNETGHVHMLRLPGSNPHHYLSGDDINITSLIELQNMEYLDLSFNSFEANQIPKQMGSFSNLRYLNLSYSSFDGRIPYELGNLSQLEYLDLHFNDLVGAIPSQLGKLTHLRYLDLGLNHLSGAIPSQLGNLSMLRTLSLSYYNSDLKINDAEWLSSLSSLTVLDLSSLTDSSHHGLQMINKFLPKLKELRLHDCFLSDNDILSLFESHSNFSTSLTILDLSYNMLTSSLFQSLSNFSFNLQHLYLSDNHIMSFPPFLKFPSLVILDLSQNNLTSSVFHGNSKLQELHLAHSSLSDNSFNAPSPSIMNSSSSLVILDLSSNMLTSSLFQSLSNFTFNLQQLYLSYNNIMSFPPSLNFPSLVFLDLSYNNFTSSVFHDNSIINSKLQELHLQNCSLSDNSFNAPSPSIMNSSSSLVILYLSNNLLTSSIIFHWVLNFTTNLHTLSLFNNLLEGPIPDGLGKEMNSLETLALSGNNLQGEILTSLGNICTLRELDLSGNNLSGEMSSFIQNSSWCNRHIFQTLYFSDNWITGLLPDLSIFSSLRELDLSNNRLIGEIPKSLGLLYKLESLFLNGNSFEGEVTELHLTNLSNLENLDLSDNSLSLKFSKVWDPPFQLSRLGLASCKLGPSFPSWLQNQRYLIFVDISNAGINDFVPVWFWNKLQSISGMNISYNNLIGTIPNLPLTLTNGDIGEYDNAYYLNSNQFEGRLPHFWLQADVLDLSKNKISDLNEFFCGKSTNSYLRTLDLSDNQIKGELSDCWGILNSLEFLDLSNNKLSGKISPPMTTFCYLQILVLRNNSFTGELPSILKNCTDLGILEMGDNMLSGSIPSWIGASLQELVVLSLRENNFIGTLPLNLCYLSQIHLLDLSGNNLSGNIPTCLNNFTSMLDGSTISNPNVGQTRLSIKDLVSYTESNVLLSWKGQEYVFKNPERLLLIIDLSSNHISGDMPTEFGQLLGLVSLNLSRNNLSGEIPSDIGNLKSLDFLDLSRNHFSGKIPTTLAQIDRLSVLDLSNNYLYGKIPLGTQLQSFDPSSFEGNLNLCGKPLEKICPEDEIPMKPQGPATTDDKDGNSVFLEGLYMSMGLGFFTGFWGLIGPLLLWRPWRNSYMRFLNNITDYAYVMVAVNVARCQRWLNG